MDMNAMQDPTALCRLCNQRPTETKVSYEEVLSSQTKRTAVSRRQSRYATRSITSHGDMLTCSSCARRYEQSVSMRTYGRRLTNWGIILMIVGGLIFAGTLASVSGSLLELATAAPVLLGVILLFVGLVLTVIGRRLKQPMIRFLQAQFSK